MRKTATGFIIITALLLIFFPACTRYKSTGNGNVSFIYKKDMSVLSPDYQVYHPSDEVTEIYYRLRSSDLLYSKSFDKDVFLAKYSISWKMKVGYQSKEILDSGTVVFEDLFNNDPEKILYGKISSKLPAGKDCIAEIELYDINRMQENIQYLPVEKTNKHQRQNFFPGTGSGTFQPLFRNSASVNEQIRFVHRDKTSTLLVRFYGRDFPLPPPPFSYHTPKGFDFRPDTFLTIKATNDTFYFSPGKPGIYHFQSDTSQVDGLTICCFSENYPKMKTYDGMIAPIRYLTSKSEHEKMMRYKNKKAAVDSFWLASGGNTDRGRDLIKKYYSRVHEANRLFTSYLEGWKTDRGLVFIVYGPPNALYRSNDGETWVYGEENNINALTFTFSRVINPFTSNDYRMERSPTYQDGWYKAANAWREGRVFIDN